MSSSRWRRQFNPGMTLAAPVIDTRLRTNSQVTVTAPDGSWSMARPLERDLLLRDGRVAPGKSMPRARTGFSLDEGGSLFIVQFRTAGLAQWRQAITEMGGEVFNYLPYHAHIVRMERSQVHSLRTLEFVERVEPYHPWYRISPHLRDWITSTPGENDGSLRLRVIALEWGTPGTRNLVKETAALGTEIITPAPAGQIVQVRATRDQLRQIARRDDVLWIDRWREPVLSNDLVRADGGANFVEDNYGYCGHGVRGEVFDAGVNEHHMDLDGMILHGRNQAAGIHGTNTYGMVFGNGDKDGDGDAKGTGQMPCADAQGISATFLYLTDRFEHTRELTEYPYNASFQSNSWGGDHTTAYTSDSFEIDDIAWRLDFVILNAQANEGTQESNPEAWGKNILSVGGISHWNTLDTSDDTWSPGAHSEGSIGPAEDGRIKPDISYWNDNIYTPTPGGYRVDFGGTSAATPASAGILGLMVEMWSDNVWNTDPHGETVFQRQPHASTIKALMINNAQQYAFTGQAHDLTRVHQGWGRPSARLAYERAATSFVVDEELPLELGESSSFDVTVAPGESELKVTMVYPDPPGTTSASMHRINDLNLRVTAPGGTAYHGNHGLLDGNESTPGGAPNDLDTVENVFVKNPTPGTWVVEVHAVEVNQDAHLATAQDDVVYGLVVTGGTSVLLQPAAGSVSLHREDYGCSKSVDIRVSDGNVGASAVNVEIRSDSESAPETVVLTETRSGSGKFSGTIFTDPGPVAAGDGLLSVSEGDIITVEYIDGNDGAGGVDVLRVDSATVDCSYAVISDVHVQELTNTSAIIAWSTDHFADSIVVYDETLPPGTVRTGTVGVSSHAVELPGLEECTVYHYEVHSPDAVENLSVDDNFGDWYTFVTLGDFGDEAWVEELIDVTAPMAGAADGRLRFGITSDDSAAYCGWNIDEVIVRDASYPEFMDCADCTGVPSFRGLSSASDEAACAAGGVTLAWEEATAWGTGSGGSYDVYRSTDPGFVPSGGNQVASGLAEISWVDDGAPVDTESWYIVRARSDESCPAEGTQDANLVRVAATETTSQPQAGSPGGSHRRRNGHRRAYLSSRSPHPTSCRRRGALLTSPPPWVWHTAVPARRKGVRS